MVKKVSIAVMLFLMLSVNGVMAGVGSSFYNMGENLGKSLARSVWNDLGNK